MPVNMPRQDWVITWQEEGGWSLGSSSEYNFAYLIAYYCITKSNFHLKYDLTLAL
jgi:hypothetical protein